MSISRLRNALARRWRTCRPVSRQTRLTRRRALAPLAVDSSRPLRV